MTPATQKEGMRLDELGRLFTMAEFHLLRNFQSADRFWVGNVEFSTKIT